jgi:short-subunit dehydrogenase
MKAVMITGAGSGLGKELAFLFSKQGYQLLLIGRTAEKLTAIKKEIEALGGNATIVPIDIRNGEQVRAKIEELSHTYQLIGLVNNAGVGHFGPFEEIDEQEISSMLDTNILGTILMTKAALPHLLKSDEARIMNIISTAGLRGKVNEAVYCASKFAVRGFTESLQKEYEKSNIKITGIYMGGMDTPFWAGSDHIKNPSALRSPKEVAEIIFEQLDQDSIIIESKKS